MTEWLARKAALRGPVPYIDLGRIRSGLDEFGGLTRVKDLTASEFRVGLRYRFADGLLASPVRNENGARGQARTPCGSETVLVDSVAEVPNRRGEQAVGEAVANDR
jgi:hypothetical protein